MKALVLHGPANLRYETNWPDPIIKKGWVLVRVKYSGICGSDLPRMMKTGAYQHPLICGHEFMGSIECPASDSDRFRKGDRVAVLPLIPCGKCSACLEKQFFHCDSYNFLGSRTDGGFAELCLVPEDNLFRLPDNVNERIGAFIEPISVALHVVRCSGFRKASRCLVFGAGTIGLLIGMWLRILGAEDVVIIDIREESLEIARQAGFKKVFHVEDKDFSRQGDFEYCFEAAGANTALLQAIEKTRRGGVISVIGRNTGNTTIPLKTFETLMRNEIVLKGCWGYNNVRDEGLIYESLQKFDIAPLISAEIPLNEGKNIISRMFHREMFFCKVLFKL